VLGWGLAGIALGIAIGSSIEAVVLTVMLRRQVPAFDPASIAGVALPVVIGSVAAGLAAFGTVAVLDAPTADLGLHVRALVHLLGGGVVGLVVYAGTTRALRLPELGVIMRLMSDTLSRLRPA
jgi:peptidoglycan biosynthesis protein MviN/MurJ (putative lipid II flippase)